MSLDSAFLIRGAMDGDYKYYTHTFIVYESNKLTRHLACVRWYGKDKRKGFFVYYKVCKPKELTRANVMLMPLEYKQVDCEACLAKLAEAKAELAKAAAE